MEDWIMNVVAFVWFVGGVALLIWYDETRSEKANEKKLNEARDLLKEVLNAGHVPPSHGILHALKVLRHTHCALKEHPEFSHNHKLAIMLAALLHDADDRKYFPKNKSYQNARRIVRKIYPDAEELVIEMIGYVSASANGNFISADAKKRPWLLYPRWADRLEAIGNIGVVRAWEYTIETNRPLFLPDTPRAKDIHELSHIATKDRYANYVYSGGKSASMIDHYYDKLLHICDFETDNRYLIDTAQKRRKPLIDICLLFGKDGRLDIDLLDMARRRAENE